MGDRERTGIMERENTGKRVGSYSRDKYIRCKLRKLAPEDRARERAKLKNKEILAYWRELGILAWAAEEKRNRA